MSSREDKNRQSPETGKQPSPATTPEKDRSKKPSGSKRSEPQPRSADQDSDRNRHLPDQEELKAGNRKGMDM